MNTVENTKQTTTSSIIFTIQLRNKATPSFNPNQKQSYISDIFANEPLSAKPEKTTRRLNF